MPSCRKERRSSGEPDGVADPPASVMRAAEPDLRLPQGVARFMLPVQGYVIGSCNGALSWRLNVT